ncbi:MAG: helix-turn-helix domain-containing protein [Candidatus Aminicenantes bacterium]|nr:helix-turn-helix domain-containing protein [Candidatus Aminicenantes bacterium]
MNLEGRRWLSVQEVAALLNCHVMTVYGWIDSGRLKAARIGRRFVRVDGRALEGELERQAASKNVN